MANMRIEDATNDNNVEGAELLPASDAGNPKNISIDQIKDFILSALLDAADADSASGVSFFGKLTSNGTVYLRNISINHVLAAAEAAIFGNTAATTLSNSAIIAFKDGSAYKTITYADFVQLLSSSTAINISGLNAASALADANLVLLDQSGNVKAQLSTLKAYVLAGLASYLSSLSAGTVSDGSNSTPTTHLLVETSGVAYSISINDLVPFFGNVTGPAETVADEIVQWSNTSRGVKGGLTLTTSVAASGSTSNTKLPTETAVRSALEALKTLLQSAISALSFCKKPANYTASNVPTLGSDDTLGSGYPVRTTLRDSTLADNASLATEAAIRSAIETAISALSTTLSNSTILRAPNGFTVGNVPTFSSATSLGVGYGVQTSVRNANSASNNHLVTEKAVRIAIDDELGDFIVGPSSVTQGYIPLWDDATTLAAGIALRDTIRASGTADDASVVTEAAIRTALDAKASATHTHSAATSSTAGFMSATDKASLDAVAGAATTDAASTLSDSDSIAVRAGGTTWKKALLSTLWTYISSKLSVATTTLAGLLPALSGNSSQFLKGDGTWGVPSGSEEFEGTDGETAGFAGLVPAPTTSDTNKFLNSNGNWESIEAAAAEDVAPEVLAITRYDTLFVPAAAMVPSASNGATASAVAFTNTKRDTLAFGPSSDNAAEFDVALPDDWNNGSLKAKFYWTCNDSGATASTNVKWLVGCIGTQDGGSVSTAPTNYEDVTDGLSQVNNVQISPATDAFAPDGNSGPGNLLHFVVKRDNTSAPASPLSKDALLLGVAIQFARTSTLSAWTNS